MSVDQRPAKTAAKACALMVVRPLNRTCAVIAATCLLPAAASRLRDGRDRRDCAQELTACYKGVWVLGCRGREYATAAKAFLAQARMFIALLRPDQLAAVVKRENAAVGRGGGFVKEGIARSNPNATRRCPRIFASESIDPVARK